MTPSKKDPVDNAKPWSSASETGRLNTGLDVGNDLLKCTTPLPEHEEEQSLTMLVRYTISSPYAGGIISWQTGEMPISGHYSLMATSSQVSTDILNTQDQISTSQRNILH